MHRAVPDWAFRAWASQKADAFLASGGSAYTDNVHRADSVAGDCFGRQCADVEKR
ncbi:hypothetical protein D9X30_5312 [Cupriavidus sp. U2]|nr:hypothetical protein D9X30_5312 [Cupriavidus sp. U2]